MSYIGQLILLAFGLVLLPADSHAKSADGVVILEGTIGEVQTRADAVTFRFTGKLRFSFFNAAQHNPLRRPLDLAFDVEGLPVRIPAFGGRELHSEDCPWSVTFKNAGLNAKEAGRSGQTVSVILFRPKLSFDTSGVIERIDSTHGQVLTDRLNHDLRDFDKRCHN